MDDQEESKPIESFDDPGSEDRIDPGGPEGSGSSHSMAATFLVGLAALVLGLFLGYVGRGQFGPEAQAAHATQTAVAQVSATQAAGLQGLMKNLVEHARHSKGPQDAKVTIIEFSDFQ